MNDIFSLIKTRHSVRNYNAYTLNTQERNEIASHIKNLPLPDSKISISWIIKHSSPLGSGKIYAEISDQPPENLVAYGFQGENIVLFLTSLQLGTCWMAVGRATEKAAPAVIVFGKEAGMNIYSRMSRFVIGGDRRKPLNTLVVQAKCQPTIEQKRILEAMRLAPSAVNRQPWQFEIENENKIIVNKLKAHPRWTWIDLGICICHGYLMAKEIFGNAQVKRLSEEIYCIDY